MIRCRMKLSRAWIGYRVSFVDTLWVTSWRRGTSTYPAGTIFTIDWLTTDGRVQLSTDNKQHAPVHMGIREINRNGGFLVIERPRQSVPERIAAGAGSGP